MNEERMIDYHYFQHLNKIGVGSDRQWLLKQLDWNPGGKLYNR